MTDYPVRDPHRCPTHPGELLREDVLPALKHSKDDVAQFPRLAPSVLEELLSEHRAITPEIAARLGKLLGNGPGIWLRMQAAHDIWHAEHDIDVSDIPTLTPA